MSPRERISKVGIVSGSLAALIVAVVLAAGMLPASGGESQDSQSVDGVDVRSTTDRNPFDRPRTLHLEVVGAEPTTPTLPPARPTTPTTVAAGLPGTEQTTGPSVGSDGDSGGDTDPTTPAVAPTDDGATPEPTTGGRQEGEDGGTSSLPPGYPGTSGHDGGDVPTTAPTIDPDQPPARPRVRLTGVEEQLVRLTNELRADPAGSLARHKPMPACVDESFYDITIDPATGHPRPAPALEADLEVSEALSRPWAAELERKGTLEHRSSDRAVAIYRELGVGISAAGENVAWLQVARHGHSDAEVALEHLEGWRESDDSHYCALMAPTFTHIAVGHEQGAEKSWAVQNFYRER